jgi:hypothetical protein
MKIDRNIAQKELTDSFCLLYGEIYRELFDTNGSKLIELGIINARRHFNEQSIQNSKKVYLFSTKSDIEKDLSKFLSEEDIVDLFNKNKVDSFSEANFAAPKDCGKLMSNIIDALKGVKPTPSRIKFDYFKKFPIYKYTKSSNLSTEAGLSLDQFRYSEVEYYLEENEEFYIAESIPYKYHGLGSILGREELRLEMVDKLKSNINYDSNTQSKQVLKNMLSAFCFDSELDNTLLDIQSVCGEESFQTREQIDKVISNANFDNLKDIFKK